MNYMPEIIKYTLLESYVRWGRFTRAILYNVKELEEYPSTEISHFFNEDSFEASDTCFNRDKDDMYLPPDVKITLTIPDKGIIKILFYIFTCDEGDKYELPEEIEEYTKKRERRSKRYKYLFSLVYS